MAIGSNIYYPVAGHSITAGSALLRPPFKAAALLFSRGELIKGRLSTWITGSKVFLRYRLSLAWNIVDRNEAKSRHIRDISREIKSKIEDRRSKWLETAEANEKFAMARF